MKSILLLAALAALPLPPCAAGPCPAGGEEWATRCFTGHGDARRVKPRYLDRLAWNTHGMATILVAQPRELLAVDRQGRVAVPDIRHTGDFDYPDAEGGIGRFRAADGRCGYFAAERFTIVIAATYDACKAFHDGEAEACTGCTSRCTDAHCHDTELVGGTGVTLAPDGTILRRHGTRRPTAPAPGTPHPPTD